jgi:hypothetical protein
MAIDKKGLEQFFKCRPREIDVVSKKAILTICLAV